MEIKVLKDILDTGGQMEQSEKALFNFICFFPVILAPPSL